jgi:uncharacterized protein (TIGR02246 family)
MPCVRMETEIRKIINRWNKAVAEGNLKELSGLLAHDKSVVCFDTGGNKHVGHDRIIKIFEEFFKTMRVHLTSTGATIKSSGNVAWVADDQHGRIVDLKGRVIMDTPLKWTSVLEKRNGRWQIVQIHHSIPMPT